MAFELFSSLVAHIGLAPVDELYGPGIQLVKIVRGIRYLIRCVTQPGHHVADGSEELCFLLLRVGVIKAQKTDPIVGLGKSQYL